MKFDILTLFPGLFCPFIEEGVLGRAVKKGLIDINLINIRSFAKGPHQATDDRPYGGGSGMVMKPGPICRALNSIKKVKERSLVILLAPQGRVFNQALAWELCQEAQLILVCGRYEGIDERVRKNCVDLELSIGDYVLSGGELGAMVVMDGVSRLIPGVLGCERSNLEESFEGGLLEYPHYTRPRMFDGMEVPQVLLSGDHGEIRLWRRTQSLKRTLSSRPDLLKQASLTNEDEKILSGLKKER